MEATFYGVLGVPRDADDQTIVHAFRERAKQCHPDVSDRPDARHAFKRLKTARDVLTDSPERARYDRLGHTAYLRRADDCPGWERPPAATSIRDDSGSASVEGGTDETVADGGHAAGRSPTGQSVSGQTASARARRYAAETDAKPSPTEASCQGSSAAADGTATAYYTPGERVNPGSDGVVDALVNAVRALGVWTLVHLLLAISAVGTAWLLLLWGSFDPLSITLASGVLLTALTVSTLHLSVRLYP
jgi:curved DNA-binding protein CbpA